MLHAIWWEVFHALWGQNKDLIYDKEKWVELQKQLEKVEQDMQTMSAQQLQEKYLMRLERHEPGIREMENRLQKFAATYGDFQRQMEEHGWIRL